jgi:hypothetical protein
MNPLSDERRLTLGTPAVYCITVLGQVNPSWSQQFNNLTIEIIDDTGPWAQTALTGSLPDQAALFGILNHLYSLGFPLLSVECLTLECH